MDNFNEKFSAIKIEVEKKLAVYLETIEDKFLKETIAYSLLSPGKRLRATLLMACAGDASALPFACAVECIHTYSLIHDDLPDMDNDDLRRGLPTNHKKFGTTAAILAGDGLLNFAFEIMLKECVENFSSEKLFAAKIIADAAGVNGMVCGQSRDTCGNCSTEDTLLDMYRRKTGAMIKASCLAGAVLNHADETTFKKLDEASNYLGEAFQIMDDLLDVFGDTNIIGKPAGSDVKNGKHTYVAVFGASAAQHRFEELSRKAVHGFEEIFGRESFPPWLAKKITKREK